MRLSYSGRATERQDQHIPMEHVPEGSEEIRLLLCRMVDRMLIGLMKRGTIGVLRPYLDDTILFLVSQCHDSYSTVKVEALLILTKLARYPQLEQVRWRALNGCTKHLPPPASRLQDVRRNMTRP